LPRLLFSGFVKFRTSKPKAVLVQSDKPQISKFALNLLKDQNTARPWLANQLNQVIMLEPQQKLVAEKLDGKKSLKNIAKEVLKDLQDDKVSAYDENNNKITEQDKLEKVAQQLVQQTVNLLSNNFALIQG